MREITSHKVNGLNEALTIRVVDEPGSGGANHHYLISHPAPGREHESVGHDIFFQNGPIKEAGVNGVSQEALLAIVEDRLRCFQAGPYASRDNEEALMQIIGAREALQRRTRERIARGVEGTHAK